MYRRLLLIALLGLTLSACVPYYDGGSTYYRSEVYTAPVPAYYYGPRYYPSGCSYYAPAPRYYQPAPRFTHGRATAGAMAGVDVVPTTEVAAAATVKYLEKQAAHHAPFFIGTVCPYCQI